MANLTGLNLDPNVEESQGEFTVIPAGIYKAVIVHDEICDTKAGTGKLLKLQLQIIEGYHQGAIVKDNLNIINPHQVAQKIGQGTLKRICNLCKVQYPPQDTSGLYGRPMAITVKVSTFTSNLTGEDLKSNKISKYDKPAGSVPQQNHFADNPTDPGFGDQPSSW